LKSRRILNRIKSVPTGVLIRKAIKKYFGKNTNRRQKSLDNEFGTFPDNAEFENVRIASLMELPDYEEIESPEIYSGLAELVLSHRFDIFGSGWLENYHGMISPGIECFRFPPPDIHIDDKFDIIPYLNKSNRERSSQILGLLPSDYKLIDWQADVRSGFRWRNSDWYLDVKYGRETGADVKVPWELSRLQHWEILTNSAALAKYYPDVFRSAKIYKNELRNQILDLIASNPPRYGVNWKIAMETAIRAVNLLVARDIMSKVAGEFDEEFNLEFTSAIWAMGNHIIGNLEWSEGLRGNHYLSNICALIIIAAYIPGFEESDSWLLFGIQELANEILYQFNSDGSNFEASLNYHYFTVEMLAWALHFMSKIDPLRIDNLFKVEQEEIGSGKKIYSPKMWKFKIKNGKIVFNDNIVRRLNKIREFNLCCMNERGKIAQIGDNDSGYFLKPVRKYKFVREIDEYRLDLSDKRDIEELFINSLEKCGLYREMHKPVKGIINLKDDFGLYVFKNDNYSVFLRCGSVGQKGKGGHAHNDQLSFCIFLKGKDFFVDPGTYIYTGIPEKRNLYRSTKYHNTLYIKHTEQNILEFFDTDGLFWLYDEAKGNIKKVADNEITVQHGGYKKPHIRKLNFDTNMITGSDYCRIRILKIVSFHLHPEVQIFAKERYKLRLCRGDTECIIEHNGSASLESYKYSPGYGELQDSSVIRLENINFEIKWKITLL
jgi:hypothetical protein